MARTLNKRLTAPGFASSQKVNGDNIEALAGKEKKAPIYKSVRAKLSYDCTAGVDSNTLTLSLRGFF